MMTKSTLNLNYDGVCVYAALKAGTSKTANAILIFLNALLMGVVILFFVADVPAGGVAFACLALFLLRYTLWNIFGEERLTINQKSVSFQYSYGFFLTALQIKKLNKRIDIVPFDETMDKEVKYLKFRIQSYDLDHDLPDYIYQSALNINETDYQNLLKYMDRLFIDELTTSYGLPAFNPN